MNNKFEVGQDVTVVVRFLTGNDVCVNGTITACDAEGVCVQLLLSSQIMTIEFDDINESYETTFEVIADHHGTN